MKHLKYFSNLIYLFVYKGLALILVIYEKGAVAQKRRDVAHRSLLVGWRY